MTWEPKNKLDDEDVDVSDDDDKDRDDDKGELYFFQMKDYGFVLRPLLKNQNSRDCEKSVLKKPVKKQSANFLSDKNTCRVYYQFVFILSDQL